MHVQSGWEFVGSKGKGMCSWVVFCFFLNPFRSGFMPSCQIKTADTRRMVKATFLSKGLNNWVV